MLFGVLTVADAWVLGWSTQHVLIPAFETGEIGTDMLLWVVALFMGVAILRAVGIVARRLGGGIMYYRMQSHTRRGVTRQYLSLPMEWHQRHPTGQLLSNAYSDVEAAWSPIMPLPMALGTVVMMVDRRRADVRRRRRDGRGRACSSSPPSWSPTCSTSATPRR